MSRETPTAADFGHEGLFYPAEHYGEEDGAACSCGKAWWPTEVNDIIQHGFEIGLSAPAQRALHADPD